MTANLYEGMFVVDRNKGGAELPDIIRLIAGILTRNGAEIERIEKWDERKLVYPINHVKWGIYILIYFRAEGDVISEVRTSFNLSEDILRVLILRVEAQSPVKGHLYSPEGESVAPQEAAPEGPAPAEETPGEDADAAAEEPVPEEAEAQAAEVLELTAVPEEAEAQPAEVIELTAAPEEAEAQPAEVIELTAAPEDAGVAAEEPGPAVAEAEPAEVREETAAEEEAEGRTTEEHE